MENRKMFNDFVPVMIAGLLILFVIGVLRVERKAKITSADIADAWLRFKASFLRSRERFLDWLENEPQPTKEEEVEPFPSSNSAEYEEMVARGRRYQLEGDKPSPPEEHPVAH